MEHQSINKNDILDKCCENQMNVLSMDVIRRKGPILIINNYY